MKKITSQIINVITLQSIIKQQPRELSRLINQPNTIITNVYFQTLLHPIVKQMTNKNRWMPNYQPILYHSGININNNNCNNNKNKNESLVLLLGNGDDYTLSQIDHQKTITLHELCGVYPKKVPLSCRPLNNEQLLTTLRKRININKHQQPIIDWICVINNNLKMWDEAIQVIIDNYQAQILIPYSQKQPTQQHYSLDLQDFESSLKVCHKLINSSLDPLKIHRYGINSQLTWLVQTRIERCQTLRVQSRLLYGPQQFVLVPQIAHKIGGLQFAVASMI